MPRQADSAAKLWSWTLLFGLTTGVAVVLLGNWSLLITCPFGLCLGYFVWGPAWTR